MSRNIQPFVDVQTGPKFLPGFVHEELTGAEEHIEDAVVYAQLRNFLSASTSLNRANLAIDMVERYLLTSGNKLETLTHQARLDTARRRVRRLIASIAD